MWLFPVLLSAVSLAMQNVYYKKNAIHVNAFIIVWATLVISSILYSPMLLWGIPHLNHLFWIATFARLVLDSVAFTLYIKGIEKSPLSLTVPMMAFIPLFLIFASFLINHLLPTPIGMIGIIVTLTGVYVLNFDHEHKELLSPFKAIYREQGVIYVLIAAFLFSIVESLQKLAIDNSNPYFYMAFFQLFWAICFIPVVYFYNKQEFMAAFNWQTIKRLLPVGGLDAVQVFGQSIALTLTLPVYVRSGQNTSILFTAILGWYFFKEKLDQHLWPILMIVIGIICISLAEQ
ncbi:MAG: DMT family transporter [Caldilineaceae bacterium]